MASKIYVHSEAEKLFRGTGAGDVLWTPQNEATAKGRLSSQLDLGDPASAARAYRYGWSITTKLGAAGAVGNYIRLYLVTSNGTIADGNMGTTDAELTSEAPLANTLLIGSLAVDAVNTILNASGVVELYRRYVQIAAWNASGQTLTNTVTDHLFYLWPIPFEGQ